MSKSLLFLISSFLIIIACSENVKKTIITENPNDTITTEKVEKKQNTDICNINTEHLSCNLIFNGKPDKNLIDKHIQILHPWILDSIPNDVKKRIESKEYFLLVSTFIGYSDLNKFQLAPYRDYVNTIERSLHMMIGSTNSYPIANISFQFLPSEKKDSSYIQINIDCSESIHQRKRKNF